MLPRCVTAHTAPPLPVEAQGTGIDGAWLQPLRLIPTEGGPVLHMLRPDAPLRPGQPCPATAARRSFLPCRPGACALCSMTKGRLRPPGARW